MANPWDRDLLPESPWERDLLPAGGKDKAKPYTVRGEIGESIDRLKSDVQTAYRPTSEQAKRQDNIVAVDRIGGDLVDVPMSVGRGMLNKFINKPLSRATGIPEDVIGATEMTAGMMLGAPTTQAALRGAMPRFGEALAAPRAVALRPPAPKAMSIDDLHAAKNAAYKAVDASGVTYTPQAFGKLVTDISTAAAKDQVNPLIHPKAAAKIGQLQQMVEAGHTPSLTELDQLRQFVRRDVANARDDAEAHFGRNIIRQIDSFVDSAGPEAVSSGTARNGAALITNARDLNTRHRKVEAVTDAMEAAKLRAGSTNSGQNVDNAIRQNLRRVLEDTHNLTPEETTLLRSIVMGDPGQNTLRAVGKLAPQGLGAQLQIASLIPSGGLSGVAGLVGAGSKVAADAITQRKVQQLLRLMSAGGKLTPN